MAAGRITIPNVSAFRQRGREFYSFTLSADDLLDLGAVNRFKETDDGVQRALHIEHVDDLEAALSDGETLLAESFLVFLEGDWLFRNGVLTGRRGSYLSVDNGQHRLEALSRLTAEQREQFEFQVTAMPLDMTFEERLQIFLQQDDNKPIDGRLKLAQRHLVGKWKTPQHKAAYKICLDLSDDEDSPLQGQLIMLDSDTRPYEKGGQARGINVKGIHNALVRVLGPNSRLAQLDIEDQTKVVKSFLRIVMEVWPRAWGSSIHILSTARGIYSLLMLFQSSPHFKALIGNDLTEDNLRRVLMMLKSYVWTQTNNDGLHVSGITKRLDNALGRASLKDASIKVD